MILKQGIAVVVLAAIALRGCLSNPLPTQAADAQSGCTDGTIKLGLPLNCAQTTAPTTLAVDNETLARLQCDAMALRQRALNFCIQHSTSTTRGECCLPRNQYQPLSLSDVVLLFINHTTEGQRLVELARKVCKNEEAKFIRGHPNEYEQCQYMLHLAENTYKRMTATLLSYRCGCPNAVLPDGKECPYEPTDRVELPEDVSLDVRGVAKWASRLADRVYFDMRSSANIRSMLKAVYNSTVAPCQGEKVNTSFC